MPKGALPNRRNVVITHQADYAAPGIEVFHSLPEALAACQGDADVYIIGGASLYEAALPLADRLCLTHIEVEPAEADTYFPPYEAADWVLESEEAHEPDERNLQPYRFAFYRRRHPKTC